jgi:3-methyladenine DNA glycosylase/8-oxoguanine DNA glycosylase
MARTISPRSVTNAPRPQVLQKLSDGALEDLALSVRRELIARTAARVARGVLSRRAGLQVVRSMEMAS